MPYSKISETMALGLVAGVLLASAGLTGCGGDGEERALLSRFFTASRLGDRTTAGRCAEMDDPLVAFPGHWAPNDIEFSTGDQFPEEYRGGAFIAFHGSWNRAPLPQGGYKIVYVEFEDGEPTGEWDTFADGFAGADVSPRGAEHRPVGLAMGPDGSLYVSDSRQGTIWRIMYTGTLGARLGEAPARPQGR